MNGLVWILVSPVVEHGWAEVYYVETTCGNEDQQVWGAFTFKGSVAANCQSDRSMVKDSNAGKVASHLNSDRVDRPRRESHSLMKSRRSRRND